MEDGNKKELQRRGGPHSMLTFGRANTTLKGHSLCVEDL